MYCRGAGANSMLNKQSQILDSEPTLHIPVNRPVGYRHILDAAEIGQVPGGIIAHVIKIPVAVIARINGHVGTTIAVEITRYGTVIIITPLIIMDKPAIDC